MERHDMTEEEVEKAIQVYAATNSYTKAAREVNTKPDSLRWRFYRSTKAAEYQERIAKAREEMRETWKSEAWGIIFQGTELLQRRLDLASMEIENFAKVIEGNCEVTTDEKRAIIRNMRELTNPRLGDITTAIASMMDKARMIDGKPTFNLQITSGEQALLEKIASLAEQDSNGEA